MKATQKTAMYQQIEKHGADLNRIFNTQFDNITLCKKLHTLEGKAHRLATQYCNGYINDTQFDVETDKVLKSVRKVLNCNDAYPIFVNGDARGYALKICDDYVKLANLKIHTDWGGYGILAPDFTPNN